MRDTSNRPSAPNYTSACVVMFGINLTWIMMVIWAIWGLIAVLATGWVINKVITYIAATRHA